MEKMEELLKDAFAELAEEDYENRSKEIPEHRFSLRFKLKMSWSMLRHWAGRRKHTQDKHGSVLELYRPVHSKRRFLVLLALLLVLLGGTVVAAESLIRWLHDVILEQHDDHLEIYKPQSEELEGTPRSGTEVQNFQRYELTEIPEGYELVEEDYMKVYEVYHVTYKNSLNDMLVVRQGSVDNANIGNITSTEEKLEELNVNGFTGYFVKDGNIGNLILSDGEALIELSGSISKQELIDLAEKLKPIS